MNGLVLLIKQWVAKKNGILLADFGIWRLVAILFKPQITGGDAGGTLLLLAGWSVMILSISAPRA